MNNWRILEDIDKKEKIKNNSAVGSISLNRQGVKNEIFYRGYNGNYEPLESRNKKCIWATSDRRNALKWGNEFDNVKVAKLRLVCKDKITSKFQDSRYDDYDAIELFELAVKKGFKGYWFDDNGAQGICADISCFEVVSENINEVVEEVDNKIDDKQVTEKDMIEQIKKLEKKLQNIYINDNAIRQDAPSIIITPNGTIIDTVDFDTHGDFLDYVYNEIVYGVDDEYDEYYNDEYDEYYSEGYSYATEALNFMTLNTGDGFYEVRCKVVMERRPSVMQVNLLGEWLEKRIDEEKPIIVFVNGLQKTYEPEDDNYSSRGIIKSIQRSFSTGILEDINFDYDGRGWITSTGEIISTNNAPHYEKEHKIKNWIENHVKYNFGYERYIGLPKNRLSSAQYETLTKLLDYFFIDKPNVGIRSTAIEINYDMNDKGDFKWKRFSPKTHTTDDIIKLIKRYYTTGRLNESSENKINIPFDSGMNTSNLKTCSNKYSSWYYFGNCIDTVDIDNLWDATEMSHVIFDSCLYLDEKNLYSGDRKIPRQVFEKNVITAVNEHQKIGIIYNIDNDIHYFFDVNNNNKIDKKATHVRFINKNEYDLNESKADQQKFIDKFGEQRWTLFNKLKARLVNKDIYYWLKKTEDELDDELRRIASQKTNKEVRSEAKRGATLIDEDENWKVYRIDTYEASKYYGYGTQWCISSADNVVNIFNIYGETSEDSNTRFKRFLSSSKSIINLQHWQ